MKPILRELGQRNFLPKRKVRFGSDGPISVKVDHLHSCECSSQTELQPNFSDLWAQWNVSMDTKFLYRQSAPKPCNYFDICIVSSWVMLFTRILLSSHVKICHAFCQSVYWVGLKTKPRLHFVLFGFLQ